jgi:glycosyltransferase involved in cell wall biosynthesis
MRYQYPEVFHYVLDKNQLTITKNKRNVSRVTSSLFNETGWNFPLTVSNIPNNTEWTRPIEIEQILPKDYANVSINNVIHKSYRYGIVMPTFGRCEYVSKSLESLRNSNLPKEETLLVIVDESLTKEVDKDKEETKQWIEGFDIEGLTIIKIYKNRHGNMFDSLLTGLDLIYPKCKYVMNLDSDTIHKKDWLNTINEVYEIAENEYPDKLIVVTGYNSNNHEIEEKKERYIIKKSVGGCHLYFRSVDYVDYLRYTLISNKWDTNVYEQVKRVGGILVSTNPSVIDHIGEISSVRKEKNIDKSLDY